MAPTSTVSPVGSSSPCGGSCVTAGTLGPTDPATVHGGDRLGGLGRAAPPAAGLGIGDGLEFTQR